ncbi:MAG: HEAT repeat domain-containing protein [Rhodopirellula sp.]|nr:HEAT repeat domain-containing protein [Rhodopirellula sp.]
MNIYLSKPFVVFSVVFVLVSLCGCSETFMIGDTTLWPPADQVSDTFPGITPPFERIQRLRDLADKSDRMPGEQKQQLSSQLAAEYQQEGDPLIRLEMLRTLAHFRTESAAKVLRTAVDDADTDIRIVACGLWGDWGGPDAVAVLKETFSRDSDVDVRLAAARALGATGDSAAISLLGTALDDPDPAMQVRAVQSLRQVTGKSFGGDVERWRQYVKGEAPLPPKPVSIADRVRGVF